MSATNLVVFDLDGTLLDTLEDIADAMNALLAEIGLPPRPLDEYRFIAGDGARVAVQRATEHRFSDDRVLALTERYLEIHHERGPRTAAPYPGVSDLLAALRERGTPMAVLTNKPHELALLTIRRVLPRTPFVSVEGVRAGTPRKPDPTGLRRLIARAGGAPADALYIGDTNTDMRTGLGANVRTIGVSWGFRDAEELRAEGAAAIIEHPMDLLDLLDPG